ncbi:MAG: DNA-processing protein DprA [Longimicrobiales bacterium]
MDDDVLVAWFMLRVIPGLGDVRRTRLLRRHRTIRATLRAALAERSASAITQIERTAEACMKASAAAGASIIPFRSPAYPRVLRHLHAPPTLLWTRGRVALLERPAIAIVGTRRNTDYGAETTRMLAADFARAGIVVVSGLAHGIDRHAHEAVLEVGGDTLAVIGSGIDVCYPRRHARLQERIARDGLIVSEFVPGEYAMRHHFPRRNRLIAALSLGVIVVEAPDRSGALNTATHALELGREVFAVPGPIGRESSAGTNALIRDGAGLVMDAADVMEPLGLVPMAQPVARSDGVARDEFVPVHDPLEIALLGALDFEPRHADELAERSRVPVPVAMATLLRLEVEGRVRQAPGLRFACRSQA